MREGSLAYSICSIICSLAMPLQGIRRCVGEWIREYIRKKLSEIVLQCVH